jgi:hypothetical protein
MINMASKSEPKNRARGNTERKLICFNCNEEGHKASSCKQESKVSTERKCRQCKKPGHNARDCKAPGAATSKGGVNRGASKNLAVANSVDRMVEESLAAVDAKSDRQAAAADGDEKEEPVNANGSALGNVETLLTTLLSQKLGELPQEFVDVWQDIPLYKLPQDQWDGKSIGERFAPIVPDEMLTFRANVQWHFLVSGYSEKTYQTAKAKAKLWLGRDVVFTPDLTEKMELIIYQVFISRHDIMTPWQKMKLAMQDKFQEVISRPRTWVAIFILDTLFNAGLIHHFGAFHATIVSGGLILVGYGLAKLYQWYRERYSKILQEDVPYIEDYCTGTTTQEVDIDSRAVLTIPRLDNFKCQPLQYANGFTTAPRDIWNPRNCTHNLLNAAQHRQLLPAIGSPEERSLTWRQGRDALIKHLHPGVPMPNWTPEEQVDAFLLKFPENIRATKKKAYVLTNTTYHTTDAVTKAFVKVEWLAGKRLEKRNPRLVSAKDDTYLMECAPEYYTYQKAFCYTYWPNTIKSLESKFIYTGGMKPDQIGEIFSYYVNDKRWEVIEGDYSRYDGHTEREALDAEFEYYGESKCLSQETINVLREQLDTRAVSALNVKFSCAGKVASGVINTSFGNTIRGFMIVASYAEEYKLEDFAVMQLGDDNVIFVPSVEIWDLPRFVLHCERMGHKLEACHRPDPELAEYCSMRFWNTGSTFVLGPKPGRVLAKTFVCHDQSLTTDDMPQYCAGIARGFQYYRFIPVLGVVTDCILRKPIKQSKKTQAALSRALRSNPYKIMLTHNVEVDPDSIYRQFVKIYGFDPKDLETLINGTDIKYGSAWHNPLFDIMSEVDGITGEDTRPWYY